MARKRKPAPDIGPPAPGRDDTTRFLHWLHGPALEARVSEDESEKLKALVWCAPSKRAFWSGSIAALSAKCRAWRSENIYTGMGQTLQPPGSGRGKAEAIDCITSLWADIDFGSHGKKPYPPAEADAAKLLDEVPLRPSIVCFSGHGLQAFWLLDVPHVFTVASDREEAAAITAGWIERIDAAAKNHGWCIDHVGDLTRLMRLPGTTNWKDKANPVPAVIRYPEPGQEPARYKLDDITAVLDKFIPLPGDVNPASITRPSESQGVPTIVQKLCENDRKFADTWNERRTEQWSPSEYDLAVASFLVAAGQDDQTIAQAIFARRLIHGQRPEKAERPDYLARTISRARKTKIAEDGRSERHEQIAAAIATIDQQVTATGDSSADQTAFRGRALHELSTIFGLPLEKIIKHGLEDARYSLVVEGGREVLLGSSAQLLDQRSIRARILEAADLVLPRVKGPQWDATITALVRCAEYVPLQEAERRVAINGHIASYFVDRSVYGDEEWTDALQNSDPFVREGRAHLNAAAFGRYIRVSTGENHPNSREVREMLRLAGFREHEVSTRIEGRVVHRRYWTGPVPESAEGPRSGE